VVAPVWRMGISLIMSMEIIPLRFTIIHKTQVSQQAPQKPTMVIPTQIIMRIGLVGVPKAHQTERLINKLGTRVPPSFSPTVPGDRVASVVTAGLRAIVTGAILIATRKAILRAIAGVTWKIWIREVTSSIQEVPIACSIRGTAPEEAIRRILILRVIV
jgi:hypothetical protein